MSTPKHRELGVWQRAIDLVMESHRLAERFPPHERFELASQVRRAAASIPANIAEGNGRLHRGDYIHHVSIARGSLMELDSHLELARRLNYVGEADLVLARELIDRVGRMLTRLAMRLRM